jgi:ABC-type glycerol-3-phosphate transport system substrate-binding protein
MDDWRRVCGLTRRRALAGATAGGATVALAACSWPAAGQPAGGARPAPVTLAFLTWRPITKEQFAPAWAEFTAKTGITLDIDNTGDGNQVKLMTMFAADTGPDLFDSNVRIVPKQYDSGFVLALDPFLARDRLNLDRDWVPTGIERWRQKTYAVPYFNEPHAVYYNKSLFQQKGIEDPWARPRNQGDWTLEEMLDAARRINDPANDVWGLDWSLTDIYGIGPLIWTQGVSHVQWDPRVEFQLQLPEVVEAQTWAIDWLMRQRLNVTAPTPEAGASRDRIQAGRPGIDVTGGTNRFAQGKIGIHWRSVNDWRRMWPIVGTAFDWDVLPVPSVKGRPGASRNNGHPVCASAKTKAPEAAWTAMRFMMGDEFQGFLAENQFYVPAKKSHQARYFRPPSQFPYQHPQVFADMFKRPYGMTWSHYNAVKNESDYGTEMAKIVRGEVPLQGGLRELERLLNQDIDYGGGENPFTGIRWPIQPK